MNKSLNLVFRVGFSVFVIALATGIYLLATGLDGLYQQTALAGTLASGMIIVCSIYEVLRSREVKPSEKIGWTVAFLFLNIIAVAIYFFMERKRITGVY